MTGKLKGTLWVLLCVVLWALIPVVSKTGQTNLDNHQFLFWSSLVSAAVLTLTTVLRNRGKEMEPLPAPVLIKLALLGLLGTYIYYLFLYLGYARSGGMEVLVVQYTWPLFIVLLSMTLLKEKLNVRKVVSLISGFAGVLIVLTKGDFSDIDMGNGEVILLVALGSFSFALFSVLSKKVTVEPMKATAIYFTTATAASFLSMMFFSNFAIPSAEEILPVLLNGILVNGFSYLFWIFALKNTDSSYLAPFTYGAPFLSTVILLLFFREPFHTAYIPGMALVLAGGLINSLRRS